MSAPPTFAPPAAAPAWTAGAGGTRARRLAFGSLALVFLAGGGLGWGLGSRFGGRAGGFGDGPGRGGPRGGGPRPGMLLDAGPIARYQLTPAQRTRVDSILGARRTEIDAFWRGPGQQLRGILDATAADVRAVLTPAQQATFDSARTERQRRMRGRGRFGPGGGPPFGGPGGPSSQPSNQPVGGPSGRQ